MKGALEEAARPRVGLSRTAPESIFSRTMRSVAAHTLDLGSEGWVSTEGTGGCSCGGNTVSMGAKQKDPVGSGKSVGLAGDRRSTGQSPGQR